MQNKNNSINNIDNSDSNINDFLISLTDQIIESALTDGQKKYFVLKMQRILNDEIKSTAAFINNTYKLEKKPDSTVTDYFKEIEKMQNKLGGYLHKFFEQMYNDSKLTATQKNDCVEHYVNKCALAETNSDRSALQKKLRAELRGFDGCVKGASQFKPHNLTRCASNLF